ncbi:uncharacterized protein LOC132630698 [Lycium barbarum]|uniref:uncharacterized protein LOC132630698 n=1 Tax=Lycium barbarum TaxID=112863 RepID=UPI00293F50D3|nr:uncharacterized protein LOC132630698 [Lycium barbarum]
MVLKQWTTSFQMGKESIRQIPLWVTFPNLPVKYWSTENLSRIASFIGNPVCTDREEERLSYARILIELDMTQPLPEQMLIEKAHGKYRTQLLDYEWWPEYCQYCMCLGHVTQKCPINQPPAATTDNAPPRAVAPAKRSKQVLTQWQAKDAPNVHADSSLPEIPPEASIPTEKEVQEDALGNKVQPVTSKARDKEKQQGETVATTSDTQNAPSSLTVQTLHEFGFIESSNKELRSFLLRNNIDHLGCLETKIKQGRADKLRKYFGTEWTCYVDYNVEPNGRIWLCWKHQNVQLTILEAQTQSIHCYVEDKGSTFKAYMTFVYGLNTNSGRNDIWTHLRMLHTNIVEPWLILGDFNTGLSVHERLNGAPVHPTEIQDFLECIEDLGVVHLPRRGYDYSWCNKREATDKIYSKINWVLGNPQWFQHFGSLEALFGSPECSEHSPIIINTYANYQRCTRPFRLLNVLLKKKRFIELVSQVWNQNIASHTMFRVWKKLTTIGTQARKLNKEMSSLESRIKNLREQLLEAQGNLRTSMFDASLINTERDTLLQLHKWDGISEQVLRQKSRETWIAYGDLNTKFFHAHLKARQTRNRIASICDEQGVKITNPTLIHQEFVTFFKQLLGSGVPSSKEGYSNGDHCLKIFDARKWFPNTDLITHLAQFSVGRRFSIKQAYISFIPQLPRRRIGTWVEEIGWLSKAVNNNRPRANILGFIAAATVYTIWVERNARRFQEANRSRKEDYHRYSTIRCRQSQGFAIENSSIQTQEVSNLREGRIRNHIEQIAPESSFFRPVDNSASSGSTVSVYQHSSPITCFSCGEVGHVSWRFPQPKQDYQPLRTPISSSGRGGTSQRGGAQSGRVLLKVLEVVPRV